MNEGDDEELELYGDDSIASKDHPVPRWLFWNYVFWIIVGLVAFGLYWNGSWGWLDPGYWRELQIVAGTTIPERNYSSTSE
jgi:hypothetical protein